MDQKIVVKKKKKKKKKKKTGEGFLINVSFKLKIYLYM